MNRTRHHKPCDNVIIAQVCQREEQRGAHEEDCTPYPRKLQERAQLRRRPPPPPGVSVFTGDRPAGDGCGLTPPEGSEFSSHVTCRPLKHVAVKRAVHAVTSDTCVPLLTTSEREGRRRRLRREDTVERFSRAGVRWTSMEHL